MKLEELEKIVIEQGKEIIALKESIKSIISKPPPGGKSDPNLENFCRGYLRYDPKIDYSKDFRLPENQKKEKEPSVQ